MMVVLGCLLLIAVGVSWGLARLIGRGVDAAARLRLTRWGFKKSPPKDVFWDE